MQPMAFSARRRWYGAFPTLAILAALTLAFSARAAADCDIPETITSDRPFDADTVIASFADSECTLQKLPGDSVFFRYYSFPEAPNINIGRFLTTDLFAINSEAIVELALYPFPPNPQFQNFAYYREQVLVAAGTELYFGVAGPQPADDIGSCYAGGAAQYFYAGANISSNPAIEFRGPPALLERDERYPNEFGVGDPCNVLPLPDTALLLGFGLVGLSTLATAKGRARVSQD